MAEITSNPFLSFLVLATILNIIFGFILGFKYHERAQFIIAFIGTMLLLTVLFLFDAVAFTANSLLFIKGSVLLFYSLITYYQAKRIIKNGRD